MDVKLLFDLVGEKAIVTGGGSGLGEQMAFALSEAGADVAVADINLEKANRVTQQIKELDREAISLKVDVAQTNEVKRMIEVVKDKFKRIDIIVNNAGIAHNLPAEKISKEDWDKVIAINLTGVFLCAQAVGKEMISQKKGSIINISSMSAFVVNRPQPQVHYNTAKAGVIMITKSLAAEWAKYNIRVNAIAPGYMRTPMTEPVLDKYRDEWVSLTPMGRIGEPYELKGAVVFLASKASSFITGSVILVDGGYTIW
ncbi:MAG: SDR family NAD(P)-dependent oxidoreductase [Candidatus Heimdallarchaeota archaeon]